MALEDNRDLEFDPSLVGVSKCTGSETFTHRILFASADRQTLELVSWNRTRGGFLAQNDRIKGLLKPNRTYLGLAATASRFKFTLVGQQVYVLFDEGNGTRLEEWEVPPSGDETRLLPNFDFGQTGPWKLIGEVPTVG